MNSVSNGRIIKIIKHKSRFFGPPGTYDMIERALELKPRIQELGSINSDLQLSGINLQDFIHVI